MIPSRFTVSLSLSAHKRKSNDSNFEYSDKVILPESVLVKLDENNLISKLTVFEIQNLEKSKNIYGGVLQYSADENSIILPNWMFTHLSLKEGQTVRIIYKKLKKLNFVKLNPMPSADKIYTFADVKPIMEDALTKFSTLTLGCTIPIKHENNVYFCKIEEIKPKVGARPGGSIIDTNLEVQFSYKEQLVEVNELTEGKEFNGFAKKGEAVYYKVSTSDRNSQFVLNLNSKSLDCDLYASAKTQYPGIENSQLRNENSLQTKKLDFSTITFTNDPINSDTSFIYVSVMSHFEDSEYTLLLQRKAIPQTNEKTELCSNCNKRIDSKIISMHRSQCKKHSKRCDRPGCQAVLRIPEFATHLHCKACGEGTNNLSKHNTLYHTTFRCECGKLIETLSGAKHRENQCALRKMPCRFCGLRLKKSDAEFHTNSCRNKSAECDFCGKRVKRMDLVFHNAVEHGVNPHLSQNREEVIDFRENFDLEDFFGDLEKYHPFDCPRCSAKIELGIDFERHFRSCGQ